MRVITQPVDRVRHAVVEARRGQQPLVVQRQEPRQNLIRRSTLDLRGGEGPTNEHRRSVTNHAGDGGDREGFPSQLDDQRISCVRQILLRIDEGAIEIEGDQRIGKRQLVIILT